MPEWDSEGDQGLHVYLSERGTVVVQGARVEAPLSPGDLPSGVECVEIPLGVWLAANEQLLASELTAEAFDEEFDRFTRTAFRLETRQDDAGAFSAHQRMACSRCCDDQRGQALAACPRRRPATQRLHALRDGCLCRERGSRGGCPDRRPCRPPGPQPAY